MTQSKHTPGAWQQTASFKIGTPKGSFTIIKAEGDIQRDEAEANARLIAAAPELLEALKKLKEAYENEVGRENGYMHHGVWIAAAAAIAKAKGEL